MTEPDLVLVESDEDDVTLILRAIGNYDPSLRTMVARDGQEAIEMFRSLKAVPRLALMDLHLARRSGIEVLRELRAMDALAHLPVILFTGSEDDEAIRKGYEAGVNSFVRKPGTLLELQTVMERLLSFWLIVNTLPRRLPNGR